tara:strand:+ start:385 stop:699 length:315 start_codon:yes stop_codon:yes gene_type:complete
MLNNPDYIKPDNQTERQKHAIGKLMCFTKKNGTLTDVSDEKTAQMTTKLAELGYTEEEAEPIIRHINITTAWINDQEDIIRLSIFETLRQQIHDDDDPSPTPMM